MSNTEHQDQDNVETIIIDQDRDLHTIAIVEKQLDNSITIKNTISETKEIVADSLEDLELNQTGAQLLSVTLESLSRVLEKDNDYKRVAIGDKRTVSIESFEYRRQRQISTEISLENLNNKWQSFWLWIAEKIKKMIRVIKQFYDRNTLLLDHLIRRIDRTQRYLKGVSLSSAVRQFKHPSLSTGLAIRGKVPLDLKSHTDNLRILTKSILSSDLVNTTQRAIDGLKRYVNNPTISISNEINDLLSPPLHFTMEDSVVNSIVAKYSSKDIFGNRKVIFYGLNTTNWTETQLVKELTSFGGRLEYIQPVTTPTDILPVLSITDLKSLLTKAREIAVDIRDYKKDLSTLFQSLNGLASFSTTLVNRKSLPGQENQVKDKLIEDLTIVIPKLAQQPALTFTSYASNVARLITYYVETCARLNNPNRK